MTAVAWAIVFATLEIGGMIDPDRGGTTAGFKAFMGLFSIAALAMVIVCTVKEWR